MTRLNREPIFLGCEVGKYPLIYMGLLFGATLRCKKIWDPVVETFEKKLRSHRGRGESGWKITSINSLSNIPIYYMSSLSISNSCFLFIFLDDFLFWFNGGSLRYLCPKVRDTDAKLLLRFSFPNCVGFIKPRPNPPEFQPYNSNAMEEYHAMANTTCEYFMASIASSWNWLDALRSYYVL